MVAVFREVRRVLADDGTLWLNLGDSYWGGKGKSGYELPHEAQERRNNGGTLQSANNVPGYGAMRPTDGKHPTIKPKDLMMMPARVAIALQDDGWWLRSDIIWAKPNPMPESVTDRPTRSHEYIFLLTKSAKYYYDAEAIKEPASESSIQRINQPNFANQTGGDKDYGENSNRSMRKTLENWAGKQRSHRDSFKRDDSKRAQVIPGQTVGTHRPDREESAYNTSMRNKRDVWTVPPATYADAHFATFPPALIEPCILAGSRPGDTVLDPFNGSGTTGAVSLEHHRQYIGIELNPAYIELSHKRISRTQFTLPMEPAIVANGDLPLPDWCNHDE